MSAAERPPVVVVCVLDDGETYSELSGCRLVELSREEAEGPDTDSIIRARARNPQAPRRGIVAASPELYDALRRVVPWLGKMIANGGHLESVAPNDAVGALEQAEAALKKARN